LNFGRCTFGFCLAAAMLSGCGESQPALAVPGVIPPSRATAPRSGGGPSILRQAATMRFLDAGDLIYVGGPTDTYILSYPDGKLVNSFRFPRASDICSNRRGDVFIPEREKILKYRHGGTKPVETLDDTGYLPAACAGDRSSGNLAVTNAGTTDDGPGNVAVYANYGGKPRFYSDPSITDYFYCTYDDQGNLFVTGMSPSNPFILAELPKGSSDFTDISIAEPIPSPSQLLWDGRYLALGSSGDLKIYRLTVTGSSAIVVGTTRLFRLGIATRTFAIHGNMILAPTGRYGNRLGFWRYPKGGRRVNAVGPLYQKKQSITGITISNG
jgi:hypothetical protein